MSIMRNVINLKIAVMKIYPSLLKDLTTKKNRILFYITNLVVQ